MTEIVRPKKYGKNRWRKVALPFYGRVALGNGTMLRIGMVQIWDEEDGRAVKDGIFLGVDDGRAYVFHTYASKNYVEEKMKMLGWDAANLTDFINAQLENGASPIGQYLDECCK